MSLARRHACSVGRARSATPNVAAQRVERQAWSTTCRWRANRRLSNKMTVYLLDRNYDICHPMISHVVRR